MPTKFTHNFIYSCILGEALLEDIDDFIDDWHSLRSPTQALHEHLGMTWEEYSLWGAEHELLPFIVIAHRDGKKLVDVLKERDSMPMAARADSPDRAHRLLEWLKSVNKF